ncbi:MAG: glycosyltransferase [Clostridia bacterium]|nr:glycosyltransferase [Clostridia bacterium]
MIKKILVISSTFTGHGHKSITEALSDHLVHYPDVSIHVIDGFNLGGNMGLRVGKMYGSVTRTAKDIWKLIWDIQCSKPSIVNDFTEIVIRESFLKLLKSIKPDLILSVHPIFNAPVINILEENNLDIPFVTLIADLVSISPLWADPRADYIICPTIESKYKCLEFGVSESKLPVLGFPIRKRFTDHIGDNNQNNDYSYDRPLDCLIMSGGEGVGNMSRIARVLLNNFNCRVKIIAGRNAILKRRLENTLKERYGDKVEIYGFVENVQDLMLSSDIAFTRGSPNTALEAVACNVPLVITGALPGQEEGNPGYILKYNLGVVCKELKNLKGTVSELLADNARKLNSIKQSQREYRDADIAKNIVDFLLKIEPKAEVDFDAIKTGSRFRGLTEFEHTRKSFMKARQNLQDVIGPKAFQRYKERIKNRNR